MTTFAYTPSYTTELTEAPKVIKSQFGDGYAARQADGINNNPQSWNLVFADISAADAAAIIAFLRTAGATTPFDWTNPDGQALRWVCASWKRTYSGYAANGVTMQFVQDFSP